MSGDIVEVLQELSDDSEFCRSYLHGLALTDDRESRLIGYFERRDIPRDVALACAAAYQVGLRHGVDFSVAQLETVRLETSRAIAAAADAVQKAEAVVVDAKSSPWHIVSIGLFMVLVVLLFLGR